jgi:hypothetical protein
MAQVRVVQIGTAQPGTNIQIGGIGRTLTAAPAGTNIQLGKFNNTYGTFYRDPSNLSAGGAGQQIQVGTHLSNRTLGYIVGTGTTATTTIATQTLPGAGYFSIWNTGNVQQTGITIQVPNSTGQQAKATGSQQPLNQQAPSYYAGFSQPLNQQAANYYGGKSQPLNQQAANYYGGNSQPLNQQAPSYYGGNYQAPAYWGGNYQAPSYYAGVHYAGWWGDFNGDGFHSGFQFYQPGYDEPGNYWGGVYQAPSYYAGVYQAPSYYGGKQQPLNQQAANYYGGNSQPLNQQPASYYGGNSQPLNQQATSYYAGVQQPAVPSTQQALSGAVYNGSLVNGGQISAQGFALYIPNIGTLTTQGGVLQGTGAGGAFQFPGTYTRTPAASVNTQQGIVNFQGTTRN